MFNFSMMTATNQAFNCVLYRFGISNMFINLIHMSFVFVSVSRAFIFSIHTFVNITEIDSQIDFFYKILCYKCDVWVNLRFYHLVFFLIRLLISCQPTTLGTTNLSLLIVFVIFFSLNFFWKLYIRSSVNDFDRLANQFDFYIRNSC